MFTPAAAVVPVFHVTPVGAVFSLAIVRKLLDGCADGASCAGRIQPSSGVPG